MVDEFLAGLRVVLLRAEQEAANPSDVVTALAFGLADVIKRAKLPTDAYYGDDALERALGAITDAFQGTRPKEPASS